MLTLARCLVDDSDQRARFDQILYFRMERIYYSLTAAIVVFVAVQSTRPATTLLVKQWVPKHEVATTVNVTEDDIQRDLIVVLLIFTLLFFIVKWILQIRIVRYSVIVWAIAVAVYTTSSHLHQTHCGGNWQEILYHTFQFKCIFLEKVKAMSHSFMF